MSGSLLQIFGHYQQGALQQLKRTIDSLSQKTGQRAKVTAPPTESDDESDAETQVCHTFRGGYRSVSLRLLKAQISAKMALTTRGQCRLTHRLNS